MEFDFFIKIIHEKIGNKSLYEFTLDFFDAAGDDNLYLTLDVVRGWFKSQGKTQSYTKLFKDTEFNDIRFNTFLKARTYGVKWRELQTYFNEVIQDKMKTVIDCTTDNHDKFIESIEFQFKIILRVPIIKNNKEIIEKNELSDENAALKKRINELEELLRHYKESSNN